MALGQHQPVVPRMLSQASTGFDQALPLEYQARLAGQSGGKEVETAARS